MNSAIILGILIAIVIFLIIRKTYLSKELSTSVIPLYGYALLRVIAFLAAVRLAYEVCFSIEMLFYIETGVETIILLIIVIPLSLGVYFLLRKAMWRVAVWLFDDKVFTYHKQELLRKEEREQEFLNKVDAGKYGEESVSYLLNHLLPTKSTYILNDLNLKIENEIVQRTKRCQIDHLVLAKNGIFCIESKNWNANIELKDGEFLYNGREFNSPILQNQIHINCLRDILVANRDQLKESKFKAEMALAHIISIIAFTHKKCKLTFNKEELPNNTLILKKEKLVQEILDYRGKFNFSDSLLKEIVGILEKYRVKKERNKGSRSQLKRMYDRWLIG